MVKQYPYKLFLSTFSGQPERDADGNYVKGTENFTEIGKCRDEAGSPGQFTTTADGQKVEFSWIVYAPKDSPDIPYGKTVKVEDEAGNIRALGTVKRFYRGQLNCRLWL